MDREYFGKSEISRKELRDFFQKGLATLIALRNQGKIEGKPEENGCYLMVRSKGDKAAVLFGETAGTVSEDRFPVIENYAKEKGYRLFLSRITDQSVMTSAATRNPEEDEWGGAVMAEEESFTISGFDSDETDEALAWFLAFYCGNLGDAEVERRASSDKVRAIFHELLEGYEAKLWK